MVDPEKAKNSNKRDIYELFKQDEEEKDENTDKKDEEDKTTEDHKIDKNAEENIDKTNKPKSVPVEKQDKVSDKQ